MADPHGVNPDFYGPIGTSYPKLWGMWRLLRDQILLSDTVLSPRGGGGVEWFRSSQQQREGLESSSLRKAVSLRRVVWLNGKLVL